MNLQPIYEEVITSLKTESPEKMPQAWIVLINGKRFHTSKRKSVWKAKNHASAAFRNEVAGMIKGRVRRELRKQDSSEEVYRNSFYLKAYEDFLTYLKENKIIEFKNLYA